MDWLNMLEEIFNLCIVPLLSVLTIYLVKFIQAKGMEIATKVEDEKHKKYITMVTDTITSCVIATNQTYVETLKKEGAFTVEAQKEAFNKTYEAVIALLSEEAKNYLTSIYGDLTNFLTQKIEAEVKINK